MTKRALMFTTSCETFGHCTTVGRLNSLLVLSETSSGRFALAKYRLARRFKLAAEDLGGALDALVSILKS